jgi:hypothetical protein
MSGHDAFNGTALGATRRSLLLAGVASLVAAPALAQSPSRQAAPRRAFLTPSEGRALTAMVDRIIPRDEWPSASEAGVVDYIDVQLATEWGRGDGLFRKGPHRPGTPRQGYQLPYTPAELYRKALASPVLANVAALDGARLDALLTRLEKNEDNLDDIPGSVFFNQLRQHVMEGYFTDPVHGGNRDHVGWRMIGFPGADAYYLTEIDRFELDYRRPPTSIGLRLGHMNLPGATRGRPADRRSTQARP